VPPDKESRRKANQVRDKTGVRSFRATARKDLTPFFFSGGPKHVIRHHQSHSAPHYAFHMVRSAAVTVQISFSETLNPRLAINGGFLDSSFNFIGGLFATSAGATLDSGSGWTHRVFSLLPGDLVPVSGRSGVTGNDVMVALGNVLELRLLNNATADWNGLPLSATLGIDNITAVPLPPALVLFASGLVALLAKRRRQNL